MKKIIRLLPAIIWMGIIFYFSSRQTTGIGGDSYWLRFAILKSFHIIEYATLFVLIFFGLQKFSLSIFISYLYGISDEIHQFFVVGRTSRFRDTLFDLLGIIIGFLFLKFIILPLLTKIKLPKKG
jgi:VanZ family protein